MQTKWFRLVIFKDGKRIEKKVHRKHMSELVRTYKQLQAVGVKCHIVGMTDARMYPNPRSIERNREEGKYWCPYCGAWRFFRVPRAYNNPEILSREWYMNVYRNSETLCCSWCDMPLKDYYICVVNRIYHEVWDSGTRRRRRRKPGVRKRVSRHVG